ncbi:MAG: hypothetical protein AB8G05_00280 [Oligoflexales bacterium]
MKSKLQLIYLFFLCSIISCGDISRSSSRNKPKIERLSDNDNENEEVDTQSENNEQDKWKSEFNGPYLHKIHGLAGPYYEIENGKFRSIEVIGSHDGYFLTEIFEGTVNLIEKRFFELQYTRSTNPYSRHQVETLKLTDFKNQKIDFLGLLKSGFIDESGLFQEHKLMSIER